MPTAPAFSDESYVQHSLALVAAIAWAAVVEERSPK
jgi:hypothetical protein